MTSFQKVIKYIAIAFGIFLAISIISTIVGIVLNVIGIGVYWEKSTTSQTEIIEEEKEFSQTYENIQSIKINVDFSNLKIIEGTELKVEGTNLRNSFSTKKQGESLVIKEEGAEFLSFSKIASEIIVTLPKDNVYDKIELEIGAGTTLIEAMYAQNIDIEFGAGAVEINTVQAEKAEMRGGAGKITIDDANIRNLDLEAGVGKLEFTGKLTGNSEIDGGVGNLRLNLKENLENYQIITQTGLGSITINGTKCADRGTYGNGNNRIKIEGGVGSIEINTER